MTANNEALRADIIQEQMPVPGSRLRDGYESLAEALNEGQREKLLSSFSYLLGEHGVNVAREEDIWLQMCLMGYSANQIAKLTQAEMMEVELTLARLDEQVGGIDWGNTTAASQPHQQEAIKSMASDLAIESPRPVEPVAARTTRNDSNEHTDVDNSGSLDTSGVDPAKIYLKELQKSELLTAEEEVDLAKAIEAGLFAEQLLAGNIDTSLPFDPSDSEQVAELEEIAATGRAAKNRFIESNLRLVVSIAKRYQGRGLDFTDLIQEGNLGLAHAVDKFDYRLGYKFSTYATNWVQQAIGRAIVNYGSNIRLPVNMYDEVRKLRGAIINAPSSTDEELCRILDITPDKLAKLRIAERRHSTTSLSSPIGVDESTTLEDLLVDTADEAVEVGSQVAQEDLLANIEACLLGLSEKERNIVSRYFGLSGRKSQTFDQIAEYYGVSRETIRKAQLRALSKIRDRLTELGYHEYADVVY